MVGNFYETFSKERTLGLVIRHSALYLSMVELATVTSCHGSCCLTRMHTLKRDRLALLIGVFSLQGNLHLFVAFTLVRQGTCRAYLFEHVEASLLRKWAAGRGLI